MHMLAYANVEGSVGAPKMVKIHTHHHRNDYHLAHGLPVSRSLPTVHPSVRPSVRGLWVAINEWTCHANGHRHRQDLRAGGRCAVVERSAQPRLESQSQSQSQSGVVGQVFPPSTLFVGWREDMGGVGGQPAGWPAGLQPSSCCLRIKRATKV